MATEQDDHDASGRAALLAALDVRRYARLSVAIGFVVAVAITVFFVWLVGGGDTTRPTPYYLGLTFVLFVAVALLAVTVLTTRRILRLTVAPASIVRRGAAGGLLAGGCWLVAAGSLLLWPRAPFEGIVRIVLPWAPLFSLTGLWAVHTRYKRLTVGSWVTGGGTLVAVVGALVVADLLVIDLPALLGEATAGEPADVGGLFLGGVVLFVAGHVIGAVVALSSEGRSGVAVALGVLPTAGAAGYVVLADPRLGLAALATGAGFAWLLVGWQLRQVRDDDVPSAPAPSLGAGVDAPD